MGENKTKPKQPRTKKWDSNSDSQWLLEYKKSVGKESHMRIVLKYYMRDISSSGYIRNVTKLFRK